MNPNEASDNKTYNITQNGTTVLPGRFVLVRLVINTKGASSNTAAIYDSDETVGANVERLKGTLDTTDSARSIEYGFPMFTGIYIVVSAGTAANITVVYKATP
jgi:hypothetical protein